MNESSLAAKKLFEPTQRRQLKLLRVLMSTRRDQQAELSHFLIQSVDLRRAVVHANDAIERKDGVLVGIANQQRSWRDQRRNHWEIPSMGIQHCDAITVTRDDAIAHVILEVGDASHWNGRLDAFVHRRRIP